MKALALFFCTLVLPAVTFYSPEATPEPLYPDVVLPNRLDPWTEPSLRDEVRLNRLEIYTEPSLRDEVRLNRLDIHTEPSLRDEIVTEESVEVQ
ncbi:MAG: hypothetical protein K8I27_16375 [Planctomycetes bacterium]|nr:hypothetical protein [Planctomycetota bacterium]